jgi:hypothetical protein
VSSAPIVVVPLAKTQPFTHNLQVNPLGGFMLAIRSRRFRLSLILLGALSLPMLPKPGHAYTPEQQQACSNDAFRLCSADIPDVDRITACMIRNKAQLSPGCRVYFREPEVSAAPPGHPLAIAPATSQRPASPKSRKE